MNVAIDNEELLRVLETFQCLFDGDLLNLLNAALEVDGGSKVIKLIELPATTEGEHQYRCEITAPVKVASEAITALRNHLGGKPRL